MLNVVVIRGLDLVALLEEERRRLATVTVVCLYPDLPVAGITDIDDTLVLAWVRANQPLTWLNFGCQDGSR